jgi:hypothetical protein
MWRRPVPSRYIPINYFYIINPLIRSKIVMAKAAFNKKKALSTSKLDLNLKNKLAMCNIFSIDWYGAKTWALRKATHKHS